MRGEMLDWLWFPLAQLRWTMDTSHSLEIMPLRRIIWNDFLMWKGPSIEKKKKEGFYCWKSEKIFLHPFILKDEDINLSLNISLVFEKGYFKKDHLMSFWGKRLLGSKTLGTNVLKLQFVYVSKPWSKHLV